MPPLSSHCPTPRPQADLRGVYCLREPVNGLWAYYAVTSTGQLLYPPRPAEIGLDTAFVVAGLYAELDEVDPVIPRLRLVAAGPPISSGAAAVSSAPQPQRALMP